MTNTPTTTRSAECFCRDLFNQGHGSECGLIEAAREAAAATRGPGAQRLLRVTAGREARSWRQLTRGRHQCATVADVEATLRALIAAGRVVAYRIDCANVAGQFTTSTVYLPADQAGSFKPRAKSSAWLYTSRDSSRARSANAAAVTTTT